MFNLLFLQDNVKDQTMIIVLLNFIILFGILKNAKLNRDSETYSPPNQQPINNYNNNNNNNNYN
jgi:hypothetical protein